MTNQTCDSSTDILGVPADRCQHVCFFLCFYLSACHSISLFLSNILSVCLPHLLLQYAVEDEDEHALQRVEDGEKVGHDHGALIDVHQAESPGQAQQTQKSYGPNHPRPTVEGREKSLTVCTCQLKLHSTFSTTSLFAMTPHTYSFFARGIVTVSLSLDQKSYSAKFVACGTMRQIRGVGEGSFRAPTLRQWDEGAIGRLCPKDL